MFVDSDDKLVPGAIEVLMDTATQKDVMIVEGGFYKLTGEALSVGHKHNKVETVPARNNLRGYPWGKVFKSELFKNLQYPEGFWFEDTVMSFLVYPQAGMAVRVPEYVYIYRDNPKSISNTAGKRPKCIDTYWVTEEMMKEYKELKLPVDETYYEKIARQVILNQKRIRGMPQEIQESVFSLTKGLIEQYLGECAAPKKYMRLFRSIQENDIGAFELYCLTH